jgi:ribosomal-protein-alanine N-acetyltransferase
MTVMETDRLILRLLELSDLDEMMLIWGDQEVMKYCGNAGTREQEMKSLQYYINMQKTKGFSPYVVMLKESGEVVGVCGFNPPDHGCDAELMYHFKKEHWGNGYATEAAGACVNFATKLESINVLGASIDPENTSSEKVLNKLGFYSVGENWCEQTGQNEPYYKKEI